MKHLKQKRYIDKFCNRNETKVSTFTSLIDVFTILLIFLLKGYSSAGFQFPLTHGINLPSAAFSNHPEPSVIISVTNEKIMLNGKDIIFVKDIKKGDSYFIAELKTSLNILKSKMIDTDSFKNRIIVEGDKTIEFELLQRIIFTCGQTGFGNISLAVLSERENL